MGCGLKVFARVDPMPVIAAHKRTMGRALNGGKAPAIELYVDKRFLCLTGNLVDGAPDEITDATEEVERLVAWLAAGTEPPEPPAAFLALLDRDELLFGAWHHGVKLGNGSDETASGLDMSLAQHLRPHLDDDDLASVLRSYRYGQLGGGKLAGKKADRRIARIIDEIGTREERTGDPPNGMTHEEWQRHGAEQAKNLRKRAGAEAVPEEPEADASERCRWTGMYSEAEAAAADLPMTKFVVAGLLPVGLTLFAAPPKIGKTWLNLGLCRAVATGDTFGGALPVQQGPVLFMDLEGNQRRTKKRSGLLRGDGVPSDELHIVHKWPPMQSGGLQQLEAAIVANGYVLIVIDIWACFRPPRPKNADIYQHVSAAE